MYKQTKTGTQHLWVTHLRIAAAIYQPLARWQQQLLQICTAVTHAFFNNERPREREKAAAKTQSTNLSLLQLLAQCCQLSSLPVKGLASSSLRLCCCLQPAELLLGLRTSGTT